MFLDFIVLLYKLYEGEFLIGIEIFGYIVLFVILLVVISGVVL